MARECNHGSSRAGAFIQHGRRGASEKLVTARIGGEVRATLDHTLPAWPRPLAVPLRRRGVLRRLGVGLVQGGSGRSPRAPGRAARLPACGAGGGPGRPLLEAADRGTSRTAGPGDQPGQTTGQGRTRGPPRRPHTRWWLSPCPLPSPSERQGRRHRRIITLGLLKRRLMCPLTQVPLPRPRCARSLDWASSRWSRRRSGRCHLRAWGRTPPSRRVRGRRRRRRGGGGSGTWSALSEPICVCRRLPTARRSFNGNPLRRWAGAGVTGSAAPSEQQQVQDVAAPGVRARATKVVEEIRVGAAGLFEGVREDPQ